MDTDDLTFLGALVFVALGVVASVMIPVLLAAVPKPPAGRGGFGGFLKRAWEIGKPYLALAVLSILVGLLVLAFFEAQDEPLKVWWQALLAGYVSDSTLQKIRDGVKRG